MSTTSPIHSFADIDNSNSNSIPKIAIIQFPGSNCETESIYAVNQAGMVAEEFLWNRSVEDLEDFDGYFIIGGFSYEDRSRSGVISAKDQLMQGIIYQARSGKPVLGICNGAQILVESGLVPCIKNLKLGGALAVNKREQDGKILGTGFYSTWVNIKPNTYSKNIFTKNLNSSDVLHLPIAHGEGRFVIPDNVLELMNKNGQLVFEYCTKDGVTTDTFPTNPNGSVMNLCAIGNPSGNVMAIMPHPERAIDKPELESKLCIKIFEAMRDYINTNKPNNYDMFVWNELEIDFQNHPKQYNPIGQEILVQSVITDKEAITINQTLTNLDIKASVSKLTHWEIVGGDIQKIIKSEELHNPNKENIITSLPILDSEKTTKNILVRYHDDFVGIEKADTLRHNNIAVTNISKGLIWQIQGDWQKVIDSNILANSFGQDVLFFESVTQDNNQYTDSQNHDHIAPNFPPDLTKSKISQISTLKTRFDRYTLSVITFAISVILFRGIEYFAVQDAILHPYSQNLNYIFGTAGLGSLFLITGSLYCIFQMMWLHHSYNIYLKINQTDESTLKKTRLLTATWAVLMNFIPILSIWEPFLNLNEMIQNNNEKSSFSLASFDSKVLILWVISIFVTALSIVSMVDLSGNNMLYNSTFSFGVIINYILEASTFVILPLTYLIIKQITEQQIKFIDNTDKN